MSEPIEIRRLGPGDFPRLVELNRLFAEVFEDPDTYGAKPPDRAYAEATLGKQHVVALAALCDGVVVGGLVAYELDKLEQEGREIYVYDLAVSAAYRRLGIATALIERLRIIGTERKAWVIFVQADYGDDPAIALYEKLGRREEVLHFDISVPASSPQ